jgi:hypothetical protein
VRPPHPYYPPPPEECPDLPFASISPTQGPPASLITISDAQMRFQPGDMAVFHLPGADPLTTGIAICDICITKDFGQMTGTVPANLSTDMQYHVAVVSAGSTEIRFGPMGFEATLGGPPGWSCVNGSVADFEYCVK